MKTEPDDDRFMALAIAESARALTDDVGGPFGAVVVRDGAVVGAGRNRVLADADPTAHAEVVALRAAARALGSHELQGCVLYTSCEPCPMCLAAAHWARVDRVVFAATRDDAAATGFDDAVLYRVVAGAPAPGDVTPPVTRAAPAVAAVGADVMRQWAARTDRQLY